MELEINPKQLRGFYYVANTLSFAKAAEQLFVTQPAVRMQIDALEDMCGIRFLSRDGRKLRLTEAGNALFAYAGQLVEVLSEAERTVLNLVEHPQGSLRLGTSKTWARYLMPTYLLRFGRLFSGVAIRLEEGGSREIVQGVLQGLYDIAIVGRVPYNERLEVLPFSGQHADELVLAMHPNHRLAGKQTVTASDFKGETLILKERGSATRDVIDQYFKDRGFSPSILLETSSAPCIKDLVKRKEGVSILTYLSIEEEERQGRIAAVPFEDDGLWLNIDIVVRKGGHRTESTSRFLSFLEECGEELLLGEN